MNVKKKIYRVLLVEDDEDIAQFVLAALNRYNFMLRHAADGRFALKCLSDESFDLMLCDIMMPYLDGFKLIEVSKQLNNPLPPLIMMTALHNKDTVLKARELGAAGFIVKPATAAQLLAKIKDVLRLSADNLIDKTTIPFSVSLGSLNNELLITLVGCPVKNPLTEIIKALNIASGNSKFSEVQIHVTGDFFYDPQAISHLDALSKYLGKNLRITRNNIRYTGNYFQELDASELRKFQENHILLAT